ncbi:MAG: shikimate dehydrogenase, partial [Desulfovibrio sp.]|nr:shikimate dehydrogenase [Desulfovibrio sp.]
MHQSPVLPPLHMYGILGTPLAQSLSPAIHNRAFASLGHPGAYFAWEKQDSELPAFFEAVRGLPIAGLSVTIPHKRTVMAFLDEISPEARRAGAVNTVFRRNEQLVGDNTDVEGFLWPLCAREAALPSAGLVLGAGGACRAALAGLSALGMTNLVVAARNP